MALTIRPARPQDAATITAIYNVGIAERAATFETEPRTVEQVAARIEQADRYPMLVAVDSETGMVVGWAGASEYRARPCYAGIGEFSIYLAVEARGQGIGKRLLTALIDAARERGFWKLLSRVFLFNTASRSLCRACGFREVGIYEKHAALDGEWLDVVIVERLLNHL
jgi:L-amino acid N-acyltransferase YncA